MANFLEQLPKHLQEIAERVNVRTPEAILTTPKVKFLDTRLCALDTCVHSCTPEDVRILKDAAAKWLAETPASADSLFRPPASLKWSRLTFGCASLDRCTGGGIVTRGITEICGISGSGKTQLLLQLSLGVQLPSRLGGLGKGVAFICTEDMFPSRRLLQICKAFEARYPEEQLNFLGNIFIEHQYESKPLLNCVHNRLPQLLQEHSIGLIIIDSVAAIFRLYTDFAERARDMRRLVNALLTYADKYQCAVVCTNQMTASLNADQQASHDVPCLGLQWANLGRTRMRISKVPKQHKVADKLLTVRKLEIIYSPETPNAFAEFLITSEGVVDVPTMPQPMPRSKQL
ncbi:DNA repair protein XRCC3 isoform X1 [Drosophila innubila]|uniref:DNA repair protein XRCC3 isoform X1 n=1 Tax=Drosophila innubila TaxID=198719 RepID=UPI00148CB04F|nr:DNA repair protein XRCC3 isoform X1 [Drosophila innubila]